MSKFLNISTDTTLGGNSASDDIVSSQKAVKAYVDSHSGGSVDIDNLSITKNSSDELQAVGVINKNTASGATNPKYDWVGTLQEYETQQVETLHPDWICFITDDVQGGSSVYTKNQVNNLLSVKANSADVYTKAETDNLLSTKTDSTDVNNAITAMLGNIYPVGSIYIGTTSTCPIASLISGSTWTIIDSSIVTSVSIPSTIPVYGNGYGLTLTNNSQTIGIAHDSDHAYAAIGATNQPWVSVGSGTSRNSSQQGLALGIPTAGQIGSDLSKSGIIAKSDNITKTSLTVNIWQRTA